jgi:hypothetical protein
MTKVEKIEHEIRKMSPEELAAFRRWFHEFDADEWDRQIERDVSEGRLDHLAEQALRDHEAGGTEEI